MIMAPPVATIDALNELLHAELGSVFRFLGDSSPYLNHAAAAIRRPLLEMAEKCHARCHELHDLIENLDGNPRVAGLHPEEQYLAYLSLKFLLPKLVDAKKLTVRRYESTINVAAGASAPIDELLKRHLSENHSELAILEKAASE